MSLKGLLHGVHFVTFAVMVDFMVSRIGQDAPSWPLWTDPLRRSYYICIFEECYWSKQNLVLQRDAECGAGGVPAGLRLHGPAAAKGRGQGRHARLEGWSSLLQSSGSGFCRIRDLVGGQDMSVDVIFPDGLFGKHPCSEIGPNMLLYQDILYSCTLSFS